MTRKRVQAGQATSAGGSIGADVDQPANGSQVLEPGVCDEFLNFFEAAQRAFGKGSVRVAYLRTATVICGHHDTRDNWNLHDELLRTRKHPFFWPRGFYQPLLTQERK